MRCPEFVRPFDPFLRACLFMGALFPLAVTRAIAPLTWDDASFLDRAVCVHRAAYAFDSPQLWGCIATMFKSPVMALLLLPAGAGDADAAYLGVAPFLLACTAMVLAAGLGWMNWRAGAPFWSAVLTALAFACCAPLAESGAPFLVDGIYAIFIALLLCLPILESGSPTHARGKVIGRGCLWGTLFGWGLLLKATFLFFAVLTAPILLFVSLRLTGVRATRAKFFSAVVVAALPAAIFFRFSRAYLDNAFRSSFGVSASLYGPERSFLGGFAHLVSETGSAYWIICAALLIGLYYGKGGTRARIALACCGVAVAYLVLAAFSRNDQPRFLWCVWVAIPATLCGLAAVPQPAPPPAGWSLVALAMVIVLASASMFTRFDWGFVRRSEAILRALNTGVPMRVEIADDPPDFNNNTFQLARQLGWQDLRQIDVSATVYHKAEGKSLEFALERLRTADFVLFLRQASGRDGPDFTNAWRPIFLDFARACGQPITLGEAARGVLIFNMRGAKDCTFPAH